MKTHHTHRWGLKEVSRLTVAAAAVPGLSAAQQEQGAFEGAEGVHVAPHQAVGEGRQGLGDVQHAREAVDQTVENKGRGGRNWLVNGGGKTQEDRCDEEWYGQRHDQRKGGGRRITWGGGCTRCSKKPRLVLAPACPL